jgi:hypothetical protein
VIPSTDGDVEAQLPEAAQRHQQQQQRQHLVQAIELSRPSTREEDGVVIVEQPRQQSQQTNPADGLGNLTPMASSAGSTEVPPTPAIAGATSTDDANLEQLVNNRLLLIKKTSQMILILTVLQIMSTLGTEHIHFLSLFSLFVPWTGYEGAKERNFAYLRAFYWGCWIMIPANFFHYLSFEQFVDEIMATGLEENVKKELMFNHTLFNVVTVVIMISMTLALVWVRQLSVMIRSLRHFIEHDLSGSADTARRESRGPTGPLRQEELAAIIAFKLSAEDIATDESGEKDVCVICQDEFQVNDLAKRLNCRHIFHAQCIDAWLERSSLCPICNGDVRSIV